IVIDFFRKVQSTNLATLVVSTISITVLSVVHFILNPRLIKRFHFPLPIELIVFGAGTIASYFIELDAVYDVRIVGTIPRGLPAPKIPDFTLFPNIFVESCVVSFVAMATTVSLVKLYAFRGGYDVQYTQEMTALGLANIFGSFFQCHSASGALARTSAASTAGMKSQVASLVSCLLILLVLTLIGPLLESVPLAVLSSIIVVSLVGVLKQITDIPTLYRASVIDMFIWLVTFLATVCLDVPYGLITGLVFSLLTVLYRTQTSFAYELAQVSGTEIYVDARYYHDAKRIPGVVILRYGGPLYYANMESFNQWILKCTRIDPHKLIKSDKMSHASDSASLPSKCPRLSCCLRQGEHGRRSSESAHVREEQIEIHTVVPEAEANFVPQEPIRCVILDIASWTFVDSVGAKMLCELVHSFARVHVDFLLTACQSQVRHTLSQGGLTENDLNRICFVSVHDAVLYAQKTMSEPSIKEADEDKDNHFMAL
ncbi:Slc26a-9, partial [Fasciola gigantica]